MRQGTALPFTLKRSTDVFSGSGMTTTTEKVHGLLRLSREHLSIQWRLVRKTDHLGEEIRSEEELEAVRQVSIPLSDVSGAMIRQRRWRWLGGLRLEVTAYDLQAFEEVAGQAGLKMAHPAQLVLRIHRRDRLAAEEFAAELALMVAERLVDGEPPRRLPGGQEADPTVLPDPTQDSG